MKKNVMKRCLATALALAITVTSVGLDWVSVSKAADAPTPDYTDAGIVADNHKDKLSTEEIAILNSGVLDVKSYTVAKPAQDSDLVAVDSNNKVVYAKNYTADGYTWYAKEALIVVGKETKETITLDTNDVTYEGKSYNASKGFTFDGNDYTVKVNYTLSMDVSAKTQQTIINLPYYLADAMNSADAMNTARLSVDEIVGNAGAYYTQAQDMVDKMTGIGAPVPASAKKAVEVLKSWADQQTKYGKSEMSYLMTKDDGYVNAGRKVENILANGTAYETCANKTYSEVEAVLGIGDYLDTLLGDNAEAAKKVLNTIKTALEPAAKEWVVLDEEKVITSDLEDSAYGDFDTLVAKAIGKSEAHTLENVATTYTVDTVAVDCNVNRYNVTVQVKATAVNAANETIDLPVKEDVVNLAGGTTKADVEAAIKEADIETDALAAWNELEGDYNVSEANYKREVTKLADTLEEDVTYVITYTPNEYEITCTNDSTFEPTKVPYGYTYTFPKLGEEGKSYEYTIAGEVVPREEGTTYRVLEDLSFTRKETKAKTPIRIHDIVIDNYNDALSTEAEAILKNHAVTSEYIYIREVEDLVKVEDEKVSVPTYDAAYGLTWKPAELRVLNGTTVVQKVTEFTSDTVTITASDYTKVEVDYKLELGLSADEVTDILNLPNTLVMEAKQQLADMATLLTYEGDIDEIIIGRLNLVKGDLSAESQVAIDKLAAACNADGKLYLSVYIDEYKALTDDVSRLNYYYQNNMYSKIKENAITLADSMEVLIEDPALPKVLKDLGFESYIEKLETASDKLGKLKDKFPAKNAKINLDSEQYNALLTAMLVDASKVPTVTANAGLALDSTFTKTASSRVIVTAVVNKLDSKGEVVSSAKYFDDFAKASGLTSADLATFEAEIAKMEADIDKDHYTSSVEGALPEAGEKLDGDVTYTITWKPVQYSVTIEDSEETVPSFTYASPNVKLPAPANAGVKYVYAIGSSTYPVEYNENGYSVVILTEDEFNALFADSTKATITRTVVDVNQERNENFVADLNEAVASISDDVNFVACKDDDGNTAIVLRINPFAGTMKEAVLAIGECIVGYPYMEMNGDVLVGAKSANDPSGIHVDTVANMLLNSGLSTGDLIAMISEDGKLVDTTKDSIAEGFTTTVEDLGALLLETTVSITNEGTDTPSYTMPMYISLTGDDKNASQYAALRKRLVQLEKVAEVEMSEGAVNVDVKLPEKVHEVYLAAMLATGDWDVNEELPSLTDMVNFALDTGVDELVLENKVTADTIINTGKEFGYDISEYKDSLDMLMRNLNKMFNKEGSEVTIVDRSNTQDAYTVNVSVDEEDIQKAAAKVYAGIADKLYGNVVADVNITVDKCNEEYKAIVVDAKAQPIKNKIDFVKESELQTTNNYTAILLLDDIDTLTADGRTYIDLNGHKVGTLVANAPVRVFDSRLVANEAGTIGKVKNPENVQLTAGNYKITPFGLFGGYTKDELEAMLPEGYEVDKNGVISNQFYALEKDGDNLTVVLTSNFVNVREVAYEKLAMEMALDIVLNTYNKIGAIDVNGKEIYNIQIQDAIAEVKGGAHGIAETVINEFVNYDNVKDLANELLAKMTDFGNLKEATAAPKSVCELTRYGWNIAATVSEKDYITASLTTEKEDTINVFLKLGKEGESTEDVEALLGALDEVVDANIKITALDLEYYQGSGLKHSLGGDVDVEVDLTKNADYLPVMGIVLANGMEDNTELVDAIKAYLSSEKPGKTTTNDLVSAIEDITSKDIVDALLAARNKTFKEMAKDLDIYDLVKAEKETLGEAYEEVLGIAGKVIGMLEFTGGGRTLESFKLTGEEYEGMHVYGIDKDQIRGYNLNGRFILKLADAKEKYTVTFQDWDGTVLSSKEYYEGETVVVPEDPTREADAEYTYTFKGWDPEIVEVVSANAVYTAQYEATKKPVDPDQPVNPDKPDQPVNPDKPANPDQPAKPSKPSTSVDTGDHSHMTMWLVLMVVSALYISVLLTNKKRKRIK